MNPAFSVILFTSIAGAAQGIVVTLAVASLLGQSPSAGFQSLAIGASLLMLIIGLGASFLHLGRPERAWRAVLMWRTSWLSREVIVLPAFITLVGLWWLATPQSTGMVTGKVLPVLILIGAALLWFCTAMIYACLRFIQEWAHPLTVLNYTLIGLASGLVLLSAAAALAGEAGFLDAIGLWAVMATIAAAISRSLSLRRNAALKPASTLQSATGIRSERLVQTSMGMSAGAFNTKEFFHGKKLSALRQVKTFFMICCFIVPLVAMLWGINSNSPVPWLIAVASHIPGIIAERWFFFAQARHPQNLYYQVVS